MMIEINKPIAIVPAKASSQRCPGKNRRHFAGIPLFMHSVNYAVQEGFVPVVSTDSEEIMAICHSQGVFTISENVDDSKMENCAIQVLGQVICDHFAILQPTSPFRKRGLLRQMYLQMLDCDGGSSFTVQDIKMIGMLDGKFHLAHRDQDAGRFFRFFDGNLLLVSKAYFERTGRFFGNSSCIYRDMAPCCWQIDTEEEYAALSNLSEHAEFSEFLPKKNQQQKKVCIVSNKGNLSRNYSRFVDSCDVVMRISKMDNIDSGLTGTRTDVILVACFWAYLQFSRQARHLEHLRNVPAIYFVKYQKETIEFTKKEGISGWQFIPDLPDRQTPGFTTLSKGVALADYLFPDAQLYFLGDCQSELRAPPGKHPYSKENVFMQQLIGRGRVIPVLEEDSSFQGVYSEGIYLRKRWKTRELCLLYGSDCELDAVIEIVGNQWSDRLRILGDRAIRRKTGDSATVECFNENELILLWDKYGREEFVNIDGGVFRLAGCGRT